MDKTEAITKVNKVGHIGQIAALVIKIVLIVSFVACLVGTIAVAAMPKGFLTLSADGVVSGNVDVAAIGETITPEQAERIVEQISEGSNVTFNGNPVDMGEVVSVDGNVISMGGRISGTLFDVRDVVPLMVAGLICIAATFASVYFFGNLAKAFRYCVSPFDANVIDAMRKFAFSLIPWVVLDSVTATAASGLGGSLGNSVNININLGMLFMVLVVFGLCYVFRYGAVLQQESDETL